MLDIMVENQEKDFMTIHKDLLKLSVILFFFLGCEEDFEDPPIPFRDFQDEVIDLGLPDYQILRPDKSHIIIPDKGVRGIILYHDTGDNYYAFEINCSFEPGSASANVRVHSSSLFLLDSSCGSNFNIPDGLPTSGPARSPLRLYETRLSGQTLTITDNSANGF